MATRLTLRSLLLVPCTALRVTILRHGETELGSGLRGSLDDDLTEQGWQQMWSALPAQPRWQRIVSSPLRRCALVPRRGLRAPLAPRVVRDVSCVSCSRTIVHASRSRSRHVTDGGLVASLHVTVAVCDA